MTSPPDIRRPIDLHESDLDPQAERDRSEILDYIAADDRGAAVRLNAAFERSTSRLADFPKLGHAGEIAGARELTPHRSYRLVYEIEGDVVWILAVVHAARQWPPR